MNWPMHGANPQYLYERASIEMPENALDFSANINPLGPPPILLDKWEELFQTVHLYPDPFASRLKEKISELHGVHPKQLLIGNGAAEIISLLGRILAGKKYYCCNLLSLNMKRYVVLMLVQSPIII